VGHRANSGFDMLDELIERHGAGAILTARPYMLDSGETLRWVLEIDGNDVPDADVRIDELPERPDWRVMFLVRGNEELEIERWSTKRYKDGPTAVIRSLGELRRGYRG
jgi:hypothetical protein